MYRQYGTLKRLIWIFLVCGMFLCLSGCNKLPIKQSLVAGINEHFQIAVNEDGTIRVQGEPYETFDFKEWQNIKSVSVGLLNAAGIKSDGTILITGSNERGACEVEEWRNITMAEFTLFVAFGLKNNGTIVYTGREYKDQITDFESKIMDQVDTWKDIVYIDTSQLSVVGLKKNGQVVASTPFTPELAEQVMEWEDVKTVSISIDTIVGLTNSGEVLVAQDKLDQMHTYKGHLERYNDMEGAVKVCSGQSYVAGLMPDGTLRIRMINAGEDWEQEVKDLDGETDVVDVNSYEDYLAVLKKDGTIIAAGYVE